MGIKKVSAHEVTCDGCGSVQVVTDKLDIVGYTGSVIEQHDSGGTGEVKFFACVAVCLQTAIEKAIEASYR